MILSIQCVLKNCPSMNIFFVCGSTQQQNPQNVIGIFNEYQ